ncbi:MAG: ester cyclase, partial [Sinobacterium sp.]|nr:ester cyclase [Sinobacterium sp.]
SLAGGFENDKKMYAWGEQYIENLSAINESHTSRLDKAISLFSDGAVIHGVKGGDGSVNDMKTYLSTIWKAFPDLIYHANGQATAWGRVAINYQAAGSHRGQWFNIPADHQPVLLTGEVVLQFNKQGKVVEAWVYDHLESVEKDYY